jgi:hypothetical protein
MHQTPQRQNRPHDIGTRVAACVAKDGDEGVGTKKLFGDDTGIHACYFVNRVVSDGDFELGLLSDDGMESKGILSWGWGR